MSKETLLESLADVKEFSLETPFDIDVIAARCAQPTCKPPPCRGCKPTCRESVEMVTPPPAEVK